MSVNFCSSTSSRSGGGAGAMVIDVVLLLISPPTEQPQLPQVISPEKATCSGCGDLNTMIGAERKTSDYGKLA
jgi:hypothetical protein